MTMVTSLEPRRAGSRAFSATRGAKAGAAETESERHQLHFIPSVRERGMPEQMRQRRDQLESSIAALRDQKEKLKDDEYYARLGETHGGASSTI